MDKEQEFAFGSVCAQLGLEKTSKFQLLLPELTHWKMRKTKAAEIQASYNALKIQKEGLDAQLTNVQNWIDNCQDELKSYKDAEEAKRKETIEQFVDNAIAEGKINSDAKTKWVEMAQNDFEMVQATLNSIPKRVKFLLKLQMTLPTLKMQKIRWPRQKRKWLRLLKLS